jgi:hypothetical protein
MESDHRLSESGDPGGKVRWRPWPCSQCAAGATPIGFLTASHGANPQVSNHASALSVNEQIEHLARLNRRNNGSSKAAKNGQMKKSRKLTSKLMENTEIVASLTIG